MHREQGLLCDSCDEELINLEYTNNSAYPHHFNSLTATVSISCGIHCNFLPQARLMCF